MVSFKRLKQDIRAYFASRGLKADMNALKLVHLRSWSKRFAHRRAVVYAPEPSPLTVKGVDHACALVAAYCSFAASRGYAVRMVSRHAVGKDTEPLHNWSPIHLPIPSDKEQVPKSKKVLYLSFAHMRGVIGFDRGARKVTVLAGTPLGDLVRLLSQPSAPEVRSLWLCRRPAEMGRWTLPVIPAPGVIAIGGCLAVGAHGTGIQALDGGYTPGSMSATVAGARVLRWNAGEGRFDVHELAEGSEALAAVSANLGRIPVLAVTLDVVPDRPQRVRMERTKQAILRGVDGSAAGSFAALAERYPAGVEAILFRPSKRQRAAGEMYAYSLAWETGGAGVELPGYSAHMTAHHRFTHLANAGDGTKGIGRHALAKFAEERARKRWKNWSKPWLTSGRARNYVTSKTMRVEPFSYAVVAPAGDVQAAVRAFHDCVDALLSPKDRPFEKHCIATEIRCTAVDVPRGGRRAPLLACTSAPTSTLENAGRLRVVWVTVLSATNGQSRKRGKKFFADLEAKLERVAAANGWTLRPEWSKCWGFAAKGGAWGRDATALRRAIRRGYGGAIAEAKGLFDGLDPKRVFAVPLHRRIGI